LRLADANRIASIGELSASMAHEINQPLSSIITNAGSPSEPSWKAAVMSASP
jgi:C4-dicarboxylate-specific signal transduction histidine kinase